MLPASTQSRWGRKYDCPGGSEVEAAVVPKGSSKSLRLELYNWGRSKYSLKFWVVRRAGELPQTKAVAIWGCQCCHVSSCLEVARQNCSQGQSEMSVHPAACIAWRRCWACSWQTRAGPQGQGGKCWPLYSWICHSQHWAAVFQL